MSRSLTVDGAVRLEGPFGPVDVVGRGGRIEVCLDRIPALSLGRKHGRTLRTARQFLASTGLEAQFLVRNQKIASLGSPAGPNVLGRLLGLREVRIHPIGCLRAVWAR